MTAKAKISVAILTNIQVPQLVIHLRLSFFIKNHLMQNRLISLVKRIKVDNQNPLWSEMHACGYKELQQQASRFGTDLRGYSVLEADAQGESNFKKAVDNAATLGVKHLLFKYNTIPELSDVSGTRSFPVLRDMATLEVISFERNNHTAFRAFLKFPIGQFVLHEIIGEKLLLSSYKAGDDDALNPDSSHETFMLRLTDDVTITDYRSNS